MHLNIAEAEDDFRRPNGLGGKLRGQGLRAEARSGATAAAFALRFSSARVIVGRRDAGHLLPHSRGFSPGPKAGRVGFTAELDGAVRLEPTAINLPHAVNMQLR